MLFFWQAGAFLLFYKICSCWVLKQMQSSCLCIREYGWLFTFPLFSLASPWNGGWSLEERKAKVSRYFCWLGNLLKFLCEIPVRYWGVILWGDFICCLVASLLDLWMWTIRFPLDADCLLKSSPHRFLPIGGILPFKQSSWRQEKKPGP